MSFEIKIDSVCDECGSRLVDMGLNADGPEGFVCLIRPCSHCMKSPEQRRELPESCPNCEITEAIRTMYSANAPFLIYAYRCAACDWEVDAITGEIINRGDDPYGQTY